ncbi:hypothetical protein BRARA_H01603 [Brassica rapa]|uniref:Uncharacterized protein n=1 Tax=Brassica campestris TaxID=3711 RepID=A0A397YBQ6_BRACM|nr:hypothetical protein BRARA_H01603 [Brassica rapa]
MKKFQSLVAIAARMKRTWLMSGGRKLNHVSDLLNHVSDRRSRQCIATLMLSLRVAIYLRLNVSFLGSVIQFYVVCLLV